MSADPLELELDRSEQRNTVTVKVIDYLAARLASLRIKNDADTLDQVQTALLRGRIAELKKLQDLLAAGENQD